MSKRFSFTIKGRLAGANEIKYADRSHWSEGAKLRKRDLELCMWTIKLAMGFWDGPYEVPVAVSFIWTEPDRRRDIDNVTSGQKAILDALVGCGVISDDSQKYVKCLTHSFTEPDKENPRIEVTVNELVPIADGAPNR